MRKKIEHIVNAVKKRCSRRGIDSEGKMSPTKKVTPEQVHAALYDYYLHSITFVVSEQIEYAKCTEEEAKEIALSVVQAIEGEVFAHGDYKSSTEADREVSEIIERELRNLTRTIAIKKNEARWGFE